MRRRIIIDFSVRDLEMVGATDLPNSDSLFICLLAVQLVKFGIWNIETFVCPKVNFLDYFHNINTFLCNSTLP